MAEPILLNVRSTPLPQRHPKIVRTLDSLPEGQALVILSDHEPRPLRAELERRFGARLRWRQSNLGDDRWEIRLVKLALADGASVAQMTLRRCDIFADAAPATLDDLTHYARRTGIKRHHCVVEQGMRWPYAGIVEAGVVQAQLVASSGGPQAMYNALPGDIFGEAALLDGGQMLLRYVALTEGTIVLLVPKERVSAAAQRDAGIRRGLERAAIEHFRSILERFSGHLSLSSLARLAAVLLPYAAPEQGLCDALAPLPTMTQVELAVEAGAAKEVVNRALRELEDAGAVERRGGRLIKLDRSRLLNAVGSG